MSRQLITKRVTNEPQLVMHNQGLVGFPASSTIKANCIIDDGARLVAVGAYATQTKLCIYTESTGWILSDVLGETVTGKQIFADSAGNVFFALYAASKLYRLAANSSVPELVLSTTTSPAFSTTGQNISSFTEDSDGNIYCTEYSGGKAIFKSSDRGVTWSIIADASGFPGSGVVPNTHYHVVYWDKYREVLLCSHGDGAGHFIQVSDDGGASWGSWLATQQCTGIAADADNIYFASDLSNDRNIYRCAVTGTGKESVLSAIPEVVWNPTKSIPLKNVLDIGFAWRIVVDMYGQIIVPFGNVNKKGQPAYLAVSSDQGDTWLVYQTPGVSGGIGSEVGFAHIFSHAENAASPWMFGLISGISSAGTDIVAWRIIPGEASINISASAGGNTFFSDGINSPWIEPVDYAVPYKTHIKLLENIDSVYLPSRGHQTINKNGFDFTGAVTSVVATDQDCEGNPLSGGWSALAGVVTLQDITNVQQGTYAVKLVRSGEGNAALSKTTAFSGTVGGALIAGQESVWMTYWQYATDLVFGAGTTQLFSVQDDAGVGNYLRLVYSVGDGWRFILRKNGASLHLRCTKPVPVILNRWTKTKIHLFRHSTAGRIQFWQDGELYADLSGLDTMPQADGGFKVFAGIISLTLGASATLWIDNIKCRYGDPDDPSGVILLPGKHQNIIP